MISGKNQIGEDLSSDSNVTFQTFDPKLNIENDTIFFEASDTEIQKATKLASDAFKIFKQVSAKKRSEFLTQISEELKLISSDIINIYCSETGLPEARCLGELGRTINQLVSFAELLKEGKYQEVSIDSPIPNRKPLPKPDLRKMLMPIGPVVVFGASNFPLAYSTAGGDSASALAAGCPVILKSHPMHAGTGELVSSAIIRAAKKTNMPNGVFSNLNSKGIEVGIKLVNSPHVKAVGFTGSLKGGRAIYDLASKRIHPIPVFAEMGSVNPVLIFPKKLKKEYAELAKQYAKSITVGSGQFCTNPGIIISFESDDFDLFIKRLVEEIEQISPSCMLHPNIYNAYNLGLEKIKKNSNVSELTREINITDKNSLSDILLDNQVIKVIHSSKQDLESIFNYYKCYPKNIFDTQIAFNFLYNEPNPSYSKLVKKYFDISLKEGSWRTNWLERPLSDEKIEYACNDVRYLVKLYHILHDQLQAEQKLDWCKEEIRNDLEIDNVIVKPKDIWKRLNISNKINNHQLVTLKKLAELRENEAITKDIPRKWIMADTLLFKISTCKASQLDQVISDTRVKLSTKILNKVREIVLNNKTVLLKDNKAVNIEEYHAQITKCNNIMDSVSNKYNIAPSFIANKKDIENFARGNKNVRFLKGWRFNIFGKLVQ